MFDATKPKFPDIQFQRIDVDDKSTADQSNKYNVASIPRAVFLDGSGEVLYNGGCPADEDSWSGLLNKYR